MGQSISFEDVMWAPATFIPHKGLITSSAKVLWRAWHTSEAAARLAALLYAWCWALRRSNDSHTLGWALGTNDEDLALEE